MGQQSSSLGPDPSLYEMPTSQFGLKSRSNTALAIWKNRHPPFSQLLQSKMAVNQESELQRIYKSFLFRYEHRYLVSTQYLTFMQQGVKGCGQIYKGSIYFQQPIANLSQIKDIPFLDTLHMYSVAFSGFDLLFKKYGYFDIFEDMFYFSDSGKMKVWCNSAAYKLEPEPYLLDSTGEQGDMITRIIHIIDENSDQSHRPSVRDRILEKLSNGWKSSTFEQIKYIWRSICRQNSWQIPERINCIASYNKEQIQKLLALQNSGLLNSDEDLSLNSPIKPIENEIYPKRLPPQSITTIRMGALHPNSMEKLEEANKIPTQKYIPAQITPVRAQYRRMQSPVKQIQSGELFKRNIISRNGSSNSSNGREVNYMHSPPSRGYSHEKNPYAFAHNVEIPPQNSYIQKSPSSPNNFTFYKPKSTCEILPLNNRSKQSVPHPPLQQPKASTQINKSQPYLHNQFNMSKPPLPKQQFIGTKINERSHIKRVSRVNFTPNFSNKQIHVTDEPIVSRNSSAEKKFPHTYEYSSRQLKRTQSSNLVLLNRNYSSSKEKESSVRANNLKDQNADEYTDPELLKMLRSQPTPSISSVTPRNPLQFSFYAQQMSQSKQSVSGSLYRNLVINSRSTNTVNDSKYRPKVDSEIWADILQLRTHQKR